MRENEHYGGCSNRNTSPDKLASIQNTAV